MSKKGKGISEEKAKRIAIGATVAGVLVIIFLVVIMVIQFVQIGVRNSEKERLDDLIEQYQGEVEKGNKDLDWYKSGEGLYWYARTYGYT